MNTKISNSENVQMIEQFLIENFDFRYNVLSKKVEVREHKDEAEFVALTEKKRNSIVRLIKLELDEVTNVKQNVQEFLDSEDIGLYDPICDWLDSLTKWDGQNRVTELFGRVPGITSEQIYWCSIWMRSTVAHWYGIDALHANETIPTFIGEQGCGKSTFCHRILPPHLREYFLDHINLSNKFDKEMALTNNLLVNLDELDQIGPTRQAELKHTVSKVKVNGRPIFGHEQYDRKRYASFVATTNNPHPLQDATGSRRYICIRIPVGTTINNEKEIEYEQLYAQLVEEVMTMKCRYWFTTSENQQIQLTNSQFQQEQDLSTMLENCFRHSEANEHTKPISVKSIIEILEHQYPNIKKTRSFSIHVGMNLRNLGYERSILHGVAYYDVVAKSIL